MTVVVKGDGYHLGLRYKGVFDIEKIQWAVRDWLETRGYEFHEDAYKLKQGKTKGKILEIYWNGWRNMNTVIRWQIYIYVHGDDVTEIKITDEKGRKKKLLKGNLYIRLDRVLIFDYRGTYEESKFKKALEHFLMKFVYRKIIDAAWEDKLRFKLYDLQTHVKHALNMTTKGSEFYSDVW